MESKKQLIRVGIAFLAVLALASVIQPAAAKKSSKVTLTSPADGSVVQTNRPVFRGRASSAKADARTVLVKVYSGSRISKRAKPLLILKAKRLKSSFRIKATKSIPKGSYAVRASQRSKKQTFYSPVQVFTVARKRSSQQTRPVAPVFNNVVPLSGSDDNTPKIFGRAPTGSKVKLYATNNCSGTPMGSGSAEAFSSSGLAIEVADNSITALRATAVLSGVTSKCSRSQITYKESTPTLGIPDFFAGYHIDDFALIQAVPGAITMVADPLGSGQTVFKVTVNEQDVYPRTPTENPRAQALSPDMINPSKEFWLKTSFLLPNDFPAEVPGWLSLISVYGPPFNGSGPWSVGLEGDQMNWRRNDTYDWDVPWSSSYPRNQWVTVLLHQKFDSNGYVEMWIDGQPIIFFAGAETSNPNDISPTAHLVMQTMDSSNNGGNNHAKIMQYRQAGMFDSATVFFKPLLIGSTRASVGG